MVTKANLGIRLILSLIGLFFALGMPIFCGYEESYSRYYEAYPYIFGITLLILSGGLFLHRNTEWKIPAQSLMIVALFNMYDFPVIHYSAAIVFFVGATYAMWNDKRVSYFGRISLFFYLLFVLDLIWFELVQIILICLFHIIYIFRMYRVHFDRNIIGALNDLENFIDKKD